ncbi:MAG: hypothetical protein FWG36_05940 [Oscillospiraceae bacterium]|nr:hypothetical protein [Oscillospiraceae bacterium]
MELTFAFPGIPYSVDSILLFENDEYNWFSSLYHFYPRLSETILSSSNTSGKKAYLLEFFKEYHEIEWLESKIADKVIAYNSHWQKYKCQVEDALSDAFRYDVKNNFNDIVGNITFNPICPRFLDTHTFDIFYLNSERGALGISLHELIHFVWFDVWQKHFGDSPEEYETPHLKWLFSEMVVDPIMCKDDRLRQINPYFEDGCVYEYFYSMNVGGKPILETLYDIYSTSDMVAFMEQGYAYCKKHETEIRSQMN